MRPSNRPSRSSAVSEALTALARVGAAAKGRLASRAQGVIVALSSALQQLPGPAGYSSYVSLREGQLDRSLLRPPQNRAASARWASSVPLRSGSVGGLAL